MYLGWAGKLMGYAAAGKPTPELRRACRAVWELCCLSAQAATFGASNLGTGDWVAHKTTGAPSQEYVVPLEQAIVDAVCEGGVEGQRALAAAAQLEFERVSVEVALALVDAAEARGVHFDGVALTGGCALNVLANQRLADALRRRKRPLGIYVPPAPNDSGQALGMLWAARPPAGVPGPLQYAGFDLWDRDDVEAAAVARGAEKLTGVDKLAAILAGGDNCTADTAPARRPIVAIVRGRQEFGPRALGHRSLVAVPDSDEVRDRMNRLKHRQWYRPTAPVVAAEAMGDLFGEERLESVHEYGAPGPRRGAREISGARPPRRHSAPPVGRGDGRPAPRAAPGRRPSHRDCRPSSTHPSTRGASPSATPRRRPRVCNVLSPTCDYESSTNAKAFKSTSGTWGAAWVETKVRPATGALTECCGGAAASSISCPAGPSLLKRPTHAYGIVRVRPFSFEPGRGYALRSHSASKSVRDGGLSVGASTRQI